MLRANVLAGKKNRLVVKVFLMNMNVVIGLEVVPSWFMASLFRIAAATGKYIDNTSSCVQF